MTPSELQTLLTLAKSMGVRRLKVDAVEVVFWATKEPEPQLSSLEKAALGEEGGMPTEDQLLFMSGIPLSDEEIKARAP